MTHQDDATLPFPPRAGLLAKARPLAIPLVAASALIAFMIWRAPFMAVRPAVFVKASFEEASSRAAAEKKLLLVDAMAEWCGPCKAMDAETWRHRAVVGWLDQHAVAFQFDVDAKPELAQRFRIEAMPTIIAMRNGEEIGRRVGGLEAGEMVEWLEGLP
jgi:thioredoxin 1